MVEWWRRRDLAALKWVGVLLSSCLLFVEPSHMLLEWCTVHAGHSINTRVRWLSLWLRLVWTACDWVIMWLPTVLHSSPLSELMSALRTEKGDWTTHIVRPACI